MWYNLAYDDSNGQEFLHNIKIFETLKKKFPGKQTYSFICKNEISGKC